MVKEHLINVNDDGIKRMLIRVSFIKNFLGVPYYEVTNVDSYGQRVIKIPLGTHLLPVVVKVAGEDRQLSLFFSFHFVVKVPSHYHLF